MTLVESIESARVLSAKARFKFVLTVVRRAVQALSEAERLLDSQVAAAHVVGPDDDAREMDLSELIELAQAEYPGATLDIVVIARYEGRGTNQEDSHAGSTQMEPRQ